MNKLQCPGCKGYKIRNSKTVAGVLIFSGLAFFVFGFGIILLLLGLIMLVKKTEFTCESCGYKWK